ncbi:hypothetical protein Tco_0090524 [Tanacetum coccineum]
MVEEYSLSLGSLSYFHSVCSSVEADTEALTFAKIAPPHSMDRCNCSHLQLHLARTDRATTWDVFHVLSFLRGFEQQQNVIISGWRYAKIRSMAATWSNIKGKDSPNVVQFCNYLFTIAMHFYGGFLDCLNIQNEALNGGGKLFVEKLPDIKVRVVHGNTLTATFILNEISKDVGEVFMKGANSKLGRAIVYKCLAQWVLGVWHIRVTMYACEYLKKGLCGSVSTVRSMYLSLVKPMIVSLHPFAATLSPSTPLLA